MIESLVNKDLCCGCGACQASCKANCITMKKDSEGFLYPETDPTLCTKCDLCESVCPVINIDRLKCKSHNLKTYGGYLKDKNELMKSASGGAFIAIARKVIKNGGFVSGVVYSEDFRYALHTCSDQVDTIEKMRGSKYIQSEKKPDLYHRIALLLKSDKFIFFSGTPCEAAALKGYLKKDYQNLITCELICHGPSSPAIQSMYIEDLEKKYSSKITGLSVRYKKRKWFPPFIKADFENGKIFCKEFYSTPFGFAFGNVALRPSCYNCKFKDGNRASDLTIGDFWGINKTYDFYNVYGTSVIIANTQRGCELMKDVDGFQLYEASYQDAVKGNPRIITPTKLIYDRKAFFELLNSKGLLYASRVLNRPKYFKGYIKRCIPGFIKSTVKNILYKK